MALEREKLKVEHEERENHVATERAERGTILVTLIASISSIKGTVTHKKITAGGETALQVACTGRFGS